MDKKKKERLAKEQAIQAAAIDSKEVIFKKLVDNAIQDIVTKGIDNVSDKTVTVACFGMLAHNSLESLTCEMRETKECVQGWFKRFTWTVLPIIISFLLALIVALVLLI